MTNYFSIYSLLVIYIYLISSIQLASSLSSWFKNKTINILDFFNSTYIEKVKGSWDFKKKFFQFDCYKEDWQLYHLHHVCTKGGYDGVLIGIDGVPNDWHHRSRKNNFILSPEEWNKRTELNTKVHPLRVHRLHENDSISDIRYLNGSTLYANCYQQPADSANPAHWMMKLGMGLSFITMSFEHFC